jgi:septal ring factor EnvC (AmiA/AmiB activator)
VVTEEHEGLRTTALLDKDYDELMLLLANWPVSPQMREALNKATGMYSRLRVASSEVGRMEAELKVILQDQERLRQDLKIVPANSAVHRRYLEKFDKQETQIEKLQEDIKKQSEQQRKHRKEYEDFLAALNVE